MGILGTKKGERKLALEKNLVALITRRNAGKSAAYTDTIGPFLQDQLVRTKRAWHEMDIDRLTDSQIVRNLMAQRATVKTIQSVIEFVEGNEQMVKQMQSDLERIEVAEKGGK